MIRLLICDDHALVRRGLRQVFTDVPGISVAAEAAAGPEALQHIRRGGIDAVLLDIALPGRDGLDVLKQVRQEFPSLPVLIVSTYPEKQYALRCLRLGAAGYLNKSADPTEFVVAVRKIAGGAMYINPAVAETLALAMRHESTQPPHELLSPREYQVFTLIAGGKTLSQAAATLALSLNTVSTYRSRIMEKIGTQNDVETALYAVRHHLVNMSAA